MVGPIVGTLLGWVEGLDVGLVVGTSEGLVVGLDDGLVVGLTGEADGEYVQRHCTGGFILLQVRGLIFSWHCEPACSESQYWSKQSTVGDIDGGPAGFVVGLVFGAFMGGNEGAHKHPIGGTRSVQELGVTIRSHRDPGYSVSQYLS